MAVRGGREAEGHEEISALSDGRRTVEKDAVARRIHHKNFVDLTGLDFGENI